MTHRSIASVIVLFALGGCVTTHPVVLGSDHPANPEAASAGFRVASVDTLDSYQSPSGFVGGSAAASTAGMDHGTQSMGAMNPAAVKTKNAGSPVQLAHEGHDDAHAVGVVNSVNAAQHKVNITHEPIPSIGWPSMTMDFDVTPSVDLSKIKQGSRVNFTMEKGKSGMYEIRAIQPAAAK